MFIYTKEIVKEAIENALLDASDKHRTLLRPIEEMSPAQKKKMSSLFSQPCDFENAIFFCDLSMFNAGKKGFVITKDMVYFTKGFMGILDSSVEIRDQILWYGGIRFISAEFDGADHYIRIEFTNSVIKQYTFNGLETFFVTILNPLVQIRQEDEKREREEERKRKKNQEREEERERKEKVEKESEERRELLLELIRDHVDKTQEDGTHHINCVRDVLECNGNIYFLAEPKLTPGELEVYQIIYDFKYMENFEFIQVDAQKATEIIRIYCDIHNIDMYKLSQAEKEDNISEDESLQTMCKVSILKGYKALYEDENYEEAIKCLKPAVEIGLFKEAYSLMGKAYILNEQWYNAVKWFEKAVEADVEDTESKELLDALRIYFDGENLKYAKEYMREAHLYEEKGEIDKAIEKTLMAAEVDPLYYFKTAVLYFKKGDYENAEKYAIKRKQADADVEDNIFLQLAEVKKSPFDKQIDKAMTQGELGYFDLSICHEEKGNLYEAKMYAQEVLKSASLPEQQKDVCRKSIERINKKLQEGAKDAFESANISFECENYEDAVESYKIAAAAGMEGGFYYVALSYKMMNELEEACKWVRKAARVGDEGAEQLAIEIQNKLSSESMEERLLRKMNKYLYVLKLNTLENQNVRDLDHLLKEPKEKKDCSKMIELILAISKENKPISDYTNAICKFYGLNTTKDLKSAERLAICAVQNNINQAYHLMYEIRDEMNSYL